MKHSKWSASKFESLMLCPGKYVLESGMPNTSSSYAREGTAAHELLTMAIEDGEPASYYIGVGIEVDGDVFTVDVDMARFVQVTIDYVKDLAGATGQVFVDQRVNYSEYLACDHDDGFGTADVIILDGQEIIIVDFKYGMGVEVSAEMNPQMLLYALGSLSAYDGVEDTYIKVTVAISQPRLSSTPSEFSITREDLLSWSNTARGAISDCLDAERCPKNIEMFLTAGEKQCKFCKAKSTCPEVRGTCLDMVVGPVTNVAEFSDLTVPGPEHIHLADTPWLAAVMAKADLMDDWLKAVRGEVERRLLDGQDVPGFKVVQGKKGSRKWSNPAEAEKTMKEVYRLKVEEMYDLSLISPTSAEKLAKAKVIGPRQWPKLQQLITQSSGKPSVAPATDSRPALTLTPAVDEFSDVSVETLA